MLDAIVGTLLVSIPLAIAALVIANMPRQCPAPLVVDMPTVQVTGHYPRAHKR